MKVKMLVSMAGRNVSHQPGDHVEVTAEIASAWRDAGIALPITEEKAAVKPAKRTATKRGIK